MVTIKMTAEDALKILGKISPENIIQVLEKVDVQIEVSQPAKAAGGCSYGTYVYGSGLSPIQYTAEPGYHTMGVGCRTVGMGQSSFSGSHNPTKA